MFVVKYVPSWLPGAGFKRKAKVWKALTMTMLHAPFNALKENVVCVTVHSKTQTVLT